MYTSLDRLDPGNPRVIVIGDTQRTMLWEFWRERNAEEARALLSEIAQRRPAALVHLGDITCGGSSSGQWAWFDSIAAPIREAAIPVAPILGNHDYYGSNARALENLRRRFPPLADRTWYSFTHRGVALVLLNSNFGDVADVEVEEQQAWYQAELDRLDHDPAIRWIVVAAHHPPFTNSRVIAPSRAVRERFVPPFESARKTVLFLSGHCHSYERFEEAGKVFVVCGGGGGPRHRLQSDPEKRRSADLFPGPEIRFFHFAELTVEEDSLRLDVIRLNDDATFAVADSVVLPPPK